MGCDGMDTWGAIDGMDGMDGMRSMEWMGSDLSFFGEILFFVFVCLFLNGHERGWFFLDLVGSVDCLSCSVGLVGLVGWLDSFFLT